MSYEWPLLIFTFLTAASVGAFICGGAPGCSSSTPAAT